MGALAHAQDQEVLLVKCFVNRMRYRDPRELRQFCFPLRKDTKYDLLAIVIPFTVRALSLSSSLLPVFSLSSFLPDVHGERAVVVVWLTFAFALSTSAMGCIQSGSAKRDRSANTCLLSALKVFPWTPSSLPPHLPPFTLLIDTCDCSCLSGASEFFVRFDSPPPGQGAPSQQDHVFFVGLSAEERAMLEVFFFFFFCFPCPSSRCASASFWYLPFLAAGSSPPPQE